MATVNARQYSLPFRPSSPVWDDVSGRTFTFPATGEHDESLRSWHQQECTQHRRDSGIMSLQPTSPTSSEPSLFPVWSSHASSPFNFDFPVSPPSFAFSPSVFANQPWAVDSEGEAEEPLHAQCILPPPVSSPAPSSFSGDSDDVWLAATPLSSNASLSSSSSSSSSCEVHVHGHGHVHSPPASPCLAASDRPRFVSRKVACQVCHFAKVRCDGGRPCQRCVRLSHTAHCTDRPSKLTNKRKSQQEQQQSQHSERSHALQPLPLPLPHHLTPPFSARHLPVDSAQLSTLFISGHLSWFEQLSAVELDGLMARMHLRDKVLQGVWMSRMLTPTDLVRLAHSLPPSRSWWRRYFAPNQYRLPEAGPSSSWLAEAGKAGRGAAQQSADCHSATRPHGRCNGSACFGYCTFLDVITEATHCRISWDRSPLHALPDAPYVPNQPFVVIRRLHDEAVTRRQEALVEALCRRLAADMGAERRNSDDGDLHHSNSKYNNNNNNNINNNNNSNKKSCSLNMLTGAPRSFLSSESEWEPECDSPVLESEFSDAPLPTALSAVAPGPVSLPLSLDVPMSVLCNASFERLFGVSQSDLRSLYTANGDAALYGLLDADDWESVLRLDKEMKLRARDEYRALVTVLTVRRERRPCVMHVQNELDADGRVLVTYCSFAPLPDDVFDHGSKRALLQTHTNEQRGDGKRVQRIASQ